MRIVVYEHVSGGAYAGQPIKPGILSEGFGMLRTATSDFKAAGHEVTVLLYYRLSKLNPPIDADYTVPIFSSQETKKFLTTIAKINDGVYIIAPEKGKTLQSLVALIEKTGKVSLNCESNSIEKVADKTVLYEILKKNGLPTPEIVTLTVEGTVAEVKRAIKETFSYPVIFKPINGVSCDGLRIIREDAQVEKAIDELKAKSARKCFIVQDFVSGEASSVSLLSTGCNALAISLNKQNVNIAEADAFSSYEGGVVPFDHSLKQEAFSVAEKVVRCFPGLRGYVGVDFVLAADKLFVVDVNPRLTTSYIGLSKTVNFNIAESIVNAVVKGRLPAKVEHNGFVCFSKVETPKPTLRAFQKAAQLKEVISPPFPLDDSNGSCALVAGQASSVDNARLRFEEAKKRLTNIICRGK